MNFGVFGSSVDNFGRGYEKTSYSFLPFISSEKFVPPTIAHWHLVKRFAGTRVGCKCKMCLKKTAIYSQKKLATWKQSSCQGAYINLISVWLWNFKDGGS